MSQRDPENQNVVESRQLVRPGPESRTSLAVETEGQAEQVIEQEQVALDEEGRQELERIKRSSGLSPARLVAISQSIRLGPRLSEVGRSAKRLAKEYRYKLNVATGNEYKARRLRYEMLEEDLLRVAERSLGEATRRFEEVKKSDKNFFDFELAHSKLSRTLGERLENKLQEHLVQGLDEALDFYRQLTPGSLTGSLERELHSVIRKKSGDQELTDEQVKRKLRDCPRIAERIWDTMVYSGRKIYQSEDLPGLIKSADRYGQEEILARYIHYLPSQAVETFQYDQEFLGVLLKFWIDHKKYRDIADNFQYLEPSFRVLDKTAQGNFIGEVYKHRPELLYDFRNVVAMNETQRKATLQGWLKHKEYYRLLDPQAEADLKIDSQMRAQAVEFYIENDPAGLVRDGIDRYKLELTPEQKQAVYQKVITGDSRGYRHERITELLRYDGITRLGLSDQEAVDLFDAYCADRSHTSTVDYQNEFNRFAEYPRVQRVLLHRLVEKSGLHHSIQSRLNDLAEQDPSQAFSLMAKASYDRVGRSLSVNFHDDPLVRTAVREDARIQQINDFAERAPSLMRKSPIVDILADRSPASLALLSPHIEEINQFPPEWINGDVFAVVVDSPDKIEDVKYCLQEQPSLANERSTLSILVQNSEHKEILVRFIQDNAGIEQTWLPAALYWVAQNPEQAKAIGEIVTDVPEILHDTNYYSRDEFLKNYDNLQPLLAIYKEYSQLQGPDTVTKTSNRLFLDRKCLQFLAYRPENISLYLDVIKQFPDTDIYRSLVPQHLEVLMKKPEAVEVLLKLPEEVPALKDYEKSPSLNYYLSDYPTFTPLAEVSKERPYVFNFGAMVFLRHHPDLIQDYVAVVRQLPVDFPEKVLFNHAEKILTNEKAKTVLLSLPQKAPLLLERDNDEALQVFMSNTELLSPLLDEVEVQQNLLLNKNGLEFMVDNEQRLPDYIALIKNMPESFPPRIVSNHIDTLMDKPAVAETVLSLNKKCPFLLESDNRYSLTYFMENHESLKPLLDVQGVNYEFLFNQSAMEYVVTNPGQVEEYATMLGRLPEDFPLQAISAWLVDKCIASDDFFATALIIAKKAPAILENGSVARNLIKEYEAISPRLDFFPRIEGELKLSVDDLAVIANLSPEDKEKYFDLILKVAVDWEIANSEYRQIIVGGVLTGEMSEEQQQKALAKYRGELGLKQNRGWGSGLLKQLATNVEALNESNWARLLSVYIAIEGDDGGFDADVSARVSELFSTTDTENKKMALEQMQAAWRQFLDSQGSELSPPAAVVAATVKNYEGAGPLKHIESLSEFMYQLSYDIRIGDKSKRRLGRARIFKGLARQEQRFEQEKWSQDERSAFYDVSNQILKAEPRLYTSFLDLLNEDPEHGYNGLNQKEVQTFCRTNLPLFQARLVILERAGSYEISELAAVKKDINDLKMAVKDKNTTDRLQIFEESRSDTLSFIQERFKERFGLLKVPESFDAEKIRSIRDIVIYMGNMADRNEDKDTKLALFLGLVLNDQWQDFRQGKDIDPAEYFEGEQLERIKEYLEKRKANNVVTSEVLGIKPEEIGEFQEILQDETVAQYIGNIETIDIKLGNIVRNIEDLGDEDIYEDGLDRQVFKLLKTHGKKVGEVLAKTYQGLSGRASIELNPEEIGLQKELATVFELSEWTTNGVKTIQDRIRTPNLIANIYRDVRSKNVPDKIEELQKRLQPTAEIVEIFNRLGEEFKQESGALALSQDLTYLENIIVKNEEKLGPGEKQKLDAYLGSISEQLAVLEQASSEIKTHFDKVKKGVHADSSSALSDRLAEVEKLVYSKQTSTAITTRVTNNLNLITENMRQCLGCMKKEVNNDTNLTFGDTNKFYVMGQSASEKGSLSDEIAFYVPMQASDGQQEMALVMDRVYGSKSSDVLVGHTLALLKKHTKLKEKFPAARTSVLVTESAMASVGFKADEFIKAIEGQALKVSVQRENQLAVNIAASAGGDHYIEFGGGGDARTAGIRTIGGVVLR